MVRVVGHQGATGHDLGNTLGGFERAVELGADVVEFDVHSTADDELVVIHDSTVDELTDGSGAVNELTLEELKELEVVGRSSDESVSTTGGEGDEIPTFDETLAVLADYDVELRVHAKSRGIGEDVVAGLKEYGVEDRTSVCSFDEAVLREIDRAADTPTEVTLSLTTSDPPDEDLLEDAADLGATWIAVNYEIADQEMVDSLKNEGYVVELWTVNDPEEIDTVLSYDPDYVCSDYPDRVKERI